MIKNILNKKIAVLGFGREGKSILKFLKKSVRYKNAIISVLDKKSDKNYLKNLNDFDEVYRSPGVPYNLLEIQKAIKKGVRFKSATTLFFEEARKIGCKIIGITGTKGKGTTSTLLYKILRASGKNVYLAGNIGKPAIDILPYLNKNSVVILELSSFQLQDLRYSPDIAAVLDVFEDHLDSHKNFKEYLNAKISISEFQHSSNKIFYFSDNKYSKLIAEHGFAEKIAVSTDNFNLFKPKELKMAGHHNFKNAVMATMIAKNLGIKEEIIKKVVRNFRGLEHRLEFVREINNVKLYNDSASTNPYTAVAAIEAFSEPKILIAGGKDKNLDYSPLKNALKKSNVKLVILFGENKQKIAKTIFRSRNKELRIMNVNNLETAVKKAYIAAKSIIHNSYFIIHIIFSPASASFDMFKDYQDRGKKFKELVKKLK
ncbi:MAG: UDP-N-acetylmuramoyl-L-alanine--D-glutamate ligase [Patescibacteria group bacterium]